MLLMKFKYGSNFRQKFQAFLEYEPRESDKKNTHSSEGLKDIGHRMSINNVILGLNSVMVSYLIHYDSLLQNATDIITKCNSYGIKKCDRSLLQNASGFLLQNETVFLQNATVVLQNATVVTNCDNFITKSDSYYKM